MDIAANPAGAPSEEVIFLGTFERPLDDKRRVQIPSEWRPVEAQKLALMVWPQHQSGTCLRVLPVTEMKQLFEAVESWANDDEDKRVLKRFIGSNATFVVPDKAGRICIPEIMAGAADLKDDAILIGVMDKFEIWSPKRQAAAVAADNTRLMRALSRVD